MNGIIYAVKHVWMRRFKMVHHMIDNCEYCGELFCQNCTDAKEWMKYCDTGCENARKKQIELELEGTDVNSD